MAIGFKSKSDGSGSITNEGTDVLIFNSDATLTFKPNNILRGGGSDLVFFENDQTITTSYTITTGKNAGSFGPITVSEGATITVPVGSTWTIS